jgi:hypothetical protein
MIPYKYLSVGSRKQSILGFQIATSDTTFGKQPVVATWESNRITLFYWNGYRWSFFEREHNEIRADESLYIFTQFSMNWSVGIGLAASKNHVYLIYKRALADTGFGLYLDRFTWQEDSSGNTVHLDLIDEHVPIPMEFNSTEFPDCHIEIIKYGPYLWAVYAEDKLHLIVQAMLREEEKVRVKLLLLTAPESVTDFSSPDAWTLRSLDDNAWGAIDVFIEDGKLACVYQSVPFIAFDHPFSPPPYITWEVNANEIEHPSIRIAMMDLSTSEINLIQPEIARGLHPQIHSLNPFIVTADRISFGGFSGHRGQRWIKNEIQELTKMIFYKGEVGPWKSGDLFVYNCLDFPRTVSPRNTALPLHRFSSMSNFGYFPPYANHVLFGRLFGFRPIYLNNIEDDPDNKGKYVDFLMQRPEHDLLAITRFFIMTEIEATQLQPSERGSVVCDINHERIPSFESTMEGKYAENIQFSPLAVEQQLDNYRNYDWYQRGGIVNNLIGGSLRAKSNKNGIKFYTYTDLGDGGGRVVYDENLEPAVPSEPLFIEKQLNPRTIIGPGSSIIEEAILQPPHGFYQFEELCKLTEDEDCSEHFYKSIGTDFDFEIDSLIWHAHDLGFTNGDWVSLSDSDAHQIQEILHFAARRQGQDFEVQGEREIAIFPTAPFSGSKTLIKCYNFGPDCRYEWTIRREAYDETDHTWVEEDEYTGSTEEPELEYMFEYGEPPDAVKQFQLQLTVFDLAAIPIEESIAYTVKKPQPKLWNVLWASHRELNAAMNEAVIGSLDLIFWKYHIQYRVEEGEPQTFRIRWEVIPHAAYRFSGTPRQYQTGQGVINLEYDIHINSEDVTIRYPILGGLFRLETISIELQYGRAYTPCILMRDWRGHHQETTQASEDERAKIGVNYMASAFSAKPISDTNLSTKKVKSKVSYAGPMAIASVAATVLIILSFYGLTGLWHELAALLGALAVAMGLPAIIGGIIVGLLIAIITAIVVWKVPRALEVVLNRIIGRQLETRKADLVDRQGLIAYAGEALGEDLSNKVSKLKEFQFNTKSGRHRFSENIFQMVFVSDNRCLVKFRRPAQE